MRAVNVSSECDRVLVESGAARINAFRSQSQIAGPDVYYFLLGDNATP
jgi:hypothetical protein